MGNVSLNLNNAGTGAGAMANFANSGFNKTLKVTEKSTKPVVKATPQAKTSNTKVGTGAGASMPTTFSGTNITTGATGSAPQITNKQLQSIGRTNPISEEDDLIQGALSDLTSGIDPVKVHAAYPELGKKWDAIMGFLSDAQSTTKTGTLYKAYPELSENSKIAMFDQVQQFTNPSAIQAVAPDAIDAIPTEPKKTLGQNVKDAGEGMVSYAGGIPKAIAETGLLDKPAEWLAKKVIKDLVNPVRNLQGKKQITDEELQARLDANPFSKEASGSQVGGDPNSKLAKGVSNTMTALEIIGGAGAIKGSLKSKALTKLVTSKTTGSRITSVIGKKVAVLSPWEKEMKGAIGKVVKTGKTATENFNRVTKAVEKETDNLINIVTKANKTVDTTAVKTAMDNVPLTISLKNDKLLAKNYKDFVSGAKKIIDAMPDNKAETLLRARKDIDILIRKELPGVFKDTTKAPLADAVKSAREVINETINKTVGGDAVKGSLHKQNLLIEAGKIIDKKATLF